jgi:hypothetical protein
MSESMCLFRKSVYTWVGGKCHAIIILCKTLTLWLGKCLAVQQQVLIWPVKQNQQRIKFHLTLSISTQPSVVACKWKYSVSSASRSGCFTSDVCVLQRRYGRGTDRDQALYWLRLPGLRREPASAPGNCHTWKAMHLNHYIVFGGLSVIALFDWVQSVPYLHKISSKIKKQKPRNYHSTSKK